MVAGYPIWHLPANPMSNTYYVVGKQVQCPHCGHWEFEKRQVLMNTRGVTFFNLDWLNRGATALTCAKCSHIEWFQDEPEEQG